MVLPFLSDESDHAITQYRKGMLCYPTRGCFAIPLDFLTYDVLRLLGCR